MAQSALNRRAALKAGALLAPAAALAAASAQAAPARERIMPVQTTWSDPPPQVAANDQMIDVGGVKLNVWDTGGTGEAVVLMHPATGSASNWAYQQPVFAKAGYRVIAFSRRGYGKSEAGSKDNAGSATGDVLSILDQLKVDRCHLVGSAAGGFVPFDVAMSHPERLRTITVASSLGGIQDPDYVKASLALLPPTFQSLAPDFRELGASYRFANPEGVRRWLELEHISAPGPRVEQKPTRPVLLADIARIKVPLLLLTGDCDLYQPPSRMRFLATVVPGAEVAILPEAGHATHWEQPQAFNTALLDFIGRHHGR